MEMVKKSFNSSIALQKLYLAQFLSAFVDNMILFITAALIKQGNYGDGYLTLVQEMFLIAYVVLAPWVGRFADKKPKASILVIGNIIKALGILALILKVPPAISYAIVGVGAVVYSPAKYGILPFLTSDEKQLMKANSALESFTILAILGGTIFGGYLADKSIMVAMVACLVLYIASILVSIFIPKDPGNASINFKNSLPELITDTKKLFSNPQSHFSLVGTGAFWMTSILLRLIMMLFIPLFFGITKEFEISVIIGLTGIGIVIGAAVTPFFISIKTYRRTMWFGILLSASVIATSFAPPILFTKMLMILAGAFGGIYIVPMNACLQEVGHKSIGAGKTIAIQNFIENIFNAIGVGVFLLIQNVVDIPQKILIPYCMQGLGVLLLIMIGYQYIYNRKNVA